MTQLVLPKSRLAKWHMLRRNARRSKVHLLKNATHVNELLTRQLFGICSWSLQAEYDVINVEYKTTLIQVNHQTQKKTIFLARYTDQSSKYNIQKHCKNK